MLKYRPLISIITVTYNAERFLEPTIQSIIAQSYKNIEYIIIDGASKDGTLEIIEKYKSYIHHLISEPDKGLYDAMNKGIKAAKGEYIWFMNAGDTIYHKHTLRDIFENCQPNACIYYGETEIISEKDHTSLGIRSEVTPHKLPKKLIWQDMALGMVVCHQAFLVKRTLAPVYNLNYKYSSDVDWVINCLKKATFVVHTHQILAKFLAGGLSKKYLLKSLRERYQVLEKHFGKILAFSNHIYILGRSVIFNLKRRITKKK